MAKNMKKLFLTITIDTENPQNALVKDIYHTDTLLMPQKHNYGIRYLLKVFDYYGIQASWFLNIYEEYLCGDRILGKLCELLRIYKQDIQLHTHPVWLMDKEHRKKVLMNQYTLAEQIYILEKGKEEVYRLGGVWPSAHRGGAYGANADTLRALERTSIKMDSSLYAGSPYCKIKSRYNNCIHALNGIIELPVSVYQINSKSGVYRNKSDINYSSYRELVQCCEQMMEHNMQYLNVFMHSFSLYKFFYRDIATADIDFSPEKKVIRKLIKFLNYLSNQPEIEIVTVREIGQRINSGDIDLERVDYVPATKRIRG